MIINGQRITTLPSSLTDKELVSQIRTLYPNAKGHIGEAIERFSAIVEGRGYNPTSSCTGVSSSNNGTCPDCGSVLRIEQ